MSWRLAGFATLADWIGSSQGWFPYRAPGPSATAYWEEVARPRARDALADAGLLDRPRISDRRGFTAITSLSDPSPVQRWAAEVMLPSGPLLALVEEVTGGGKTEAAVVLAHRLMADGRAQGLYVSRPASPTTPSSPSTGSAPTSMPLRASC